VWQNVVVGLPRAGAREAAQRVLAEVGLGTRAMSWPSVLSGGEGARVALARALVREPRLLLLDEPFASLDALTRLQMQDWLAGTLHADPRTVVFVTHDVEEAVVLADRVVVLSGRPGRVLATLEVDAARPRRRDDPELVALRARALEELGA
jgi:sulfonate transport system ATP-binding protein